MQYLLFQKQTLFLRDFVEINFLLFAILVINHCKDISFKRNFKIRKIKYNIILGVKILSQILLFFEG
jgi:hypothetical protein